MSIKHLLSGLTLVMLVCFSATAQSLPERTASAACNCLGTIANADTLQQRLKRCLPEGMVTAMANGSAKDRETMNTVEGIQGNIKQAAQLLPSVCPEVKRVLDAQPKPLQAAAAEPNAKEAQYYRLSASETANKYYDEGNNLLKQQNYKAALKQFEKAAEADKQFVYALDHIAICHRQLGNLDKALEAYSKSLAVYPEGNLALLNTAVVYSLKKDWANSLKYYELLRQYHPNDPEGYFGVGRMAMLQENFEVALDNLFKAHQLYVDANSPYREDSSKLVGALYGHMKANGQLDLFMRKAKQYGIEINVQP
ncbi:tetratricopeptide repeat protein [Hymenobacter latericus]|uniref:tetratricopeptide repeat protein n=1 Tax=Hymenobacter sp. YIM 151858-1 TaxID=2987688 RepID=UPI00222691BE|nr:tetratricopeptide repeat protein [Hymenobacter sp. YIM 151858-1]UYZ59490.1 tetratricopeptide repeat protein [Hymenobacter sp. YIM 151858-1]